MQPLSRFAFLLFPAALASVACSPSSENAGPGQLADAAKGSEQVSERHFSKVTVPCGDPAQTARALLAWTSRDLGEGTTTQLVDYQTDRVPLKDGEGTIAVIVYSVSAAEEEATSLITTEHFLIHDSCRVMHWSSAVRPGQRTSVVDAK